MQAVFCPSCREEVDPDDLFCRRCGSDQRPPVHGAAPKKQLTRREMRNAVIMLSSLALNAILIASLAINKLRVPPSKPPTPFYLPEFRPQVAAQTPIRPTQESVQSGVAPPPAPLSLHRGVRPNGFVSPPSLPTTGGVRLNTATFPPTPIVDRSQRPSDRSSSLSPPPTPEIEQSLPLSSSGSAQSGR